MSSINWVILNPTGTPSPLPQEKFLLSTPSVALSLFPSTPGAPLSQSPASKATEYRAIGTTHVSNQRVVFVADGAASASSLAAGSASVTGVAQGERPPLQSFSSPYSHFLDGRYVQPWFAATYYEALAMPGPGGGLEVSGVSDRRWGSGADARSCCRDRTWSGSRSRRVAERRSSRSCRR